MRIETVQDLYKQFPYIDNYWQHEELQDVENEIRQQLPGPSDGWNLKALEAYTQLARVYNIAGKHKEAQMVLDDSYDGLAKIDPSSEKSRVEVRLTLEEGRHLWLARNPAKAQRFFQQAFKQAMDEGLEFFAIDAAIMISISQPPRFKNEWLQRALIMAENAKSEEGRLWLSHLYMMNGWHLFDFRRFEDALTSFKNALDRPRVSGESTDIVYIRWSLARALRGLGRNQEAMEIQNQLLQELRSQQQVNGHVYLEMAECLQTLQKTEEAKEYFELAYNELNANTWYSDNKTAELRRMQFLYKLK